MYKTNTQTSRSTDKLLLLRTMLETNTNNLRKERKAKTRLRHQRTTTIYKHDQKITNKNYIQHEK